jgi:hypothetical protein
MNNNKKMIANVRKGLENEIYKSVRLVKSHVPEEERILIPYSKITDPSKAKARIDHIVYQIENVLGPGEYIIECRTGNNPGSMVDAFPIKIRERPVYTPPQAGESTAVQERIEDKTFEQEDMANFDFEDYVRLIKENEMLKAKVSLLMTQLELEQTKPQLNDAVPSIGEKAFQALADNVPTILTIFDKYFQQRDRHMDIEEKKLNGRNGFKKKVRTNVVEEVEPSREQKLEFMEELEESDPVAFDATMDEMQEKDPELYAYICKEMDLVDEDEEEEQPQE